MALGLAALAVGGRLTGTGPTGPEKRKLLEESGWQSHSVNVAPPGAEPRWIDYTNFGPVSVPIAITAASWEGVQEGQKPHHEVAADVTGRVARILLDTSYLKGMATFFQAATGGAAGVASAAGNVVNTMVPYGGGLAGLERLVDPTVRATDVPGASTAARIPGLSGLLPEQIGLYGKPKTTGENDLAAQVLLPWRTSTTRPDPVAQEVARLTAAGQSTGVRAFSDTYAGAKQSPEQQRLLQGEAGKMMATYLADYIARPEYAAATDEGKARTLSNAAATAYELADLRLGDQLERDPRHKALLSWASVPHYEGMKGTPEQMREKNFEIAQAKAKLAEYRQKYKDPDLADAHLLKDDRKAFFASQLPPMDSNYLRLKKAVVDKVFGGALTQAEKEGLIGSGNTVIKTGP
jgi:hypothetical protein